MLSKLLIVYLINIGAFPLIVIGLFDFGILYTNPTSLFAMIVLGELFLGGILLVKIAYNPEEEKEETVKGIVNT